MQRWRERESQHSSMAREHQHLVFPKLLSFHLCALLMGPSVGVRPGCSCSLIPVLMGDCPGAAGKNRQWHLHDRAVLQNSISTLKGDLPRAVLEGSGLPCKWLPRACPSPRNRLQIVSLLCLFLHRPCVMRSGSQHGIPGTEMSLKYEGLDVSRWWLVPTQVVTFPQLILLGFYSMQ